MVMVNAMLSSQDLPFKLGGKEIFTASHVLNYVPRENLDKTPYGLN